MGKALVVYMTGGQKRTFPAESYSEHEAGVLTIREKYNQPEWWVSFNLRYVMQWGPEEVEQ